MTIPSAEWVKFDQTLYNLKLQEPSLRMHSETKARWRKVCTEYRKLGQGDGIGLYTGLVDSALTVFGEFLREVDRICRDVWRTQGRSETPEFVRAVRDYAVFPLIAARCGAIHGEIELRARQVGFTRLTPALHHLAQEQAKLQGILSNRYEIEARELALKAASSSERRASPVSRTFTQARTEETMSEFNVWKEFHDKFQLLANEEARIVEAAHKDCVLRAYSTYEEHVEVREVRRDARWAFVMFNSTYEVHPEVPEVIETRKIPFGPFCWLKTPECGVWILSEGPNENFRERFQTLATRAGITLGAPQGSVPEDFWLHRLFHDLLENKSNELLAAEKDRGGMIRRVCEASATFCSSLEKKALETSIATAEGRGQKPTGQRESFVKPILDEKGWSILDWANESEVDFHTASGYLKGKTNPYRSTRKKLAESLGVKVEDLPK